MKDFRDEVALAVLLETLRNTVSTARIVAEGKKLDASPCEALSAYAYLMADAMMIAREPKKLTIEETKAEMRRLGFSEDMITALDTP